MDFEFYLKQGFFHVLDLRALDHILFFIAVTVIFTLKDWKKALLLVTFFTLGHTFTFALSAYDILFINESYVEFLIPITIAIPLFWNSFNILKSRTLKSVNMYFTFFFGLIHGLGFSSYFKMLLDDDESILKPLLEFALGIELVQILIVFLVLLLGFLVQKQLKISKKYWVIGISFLILLKILPMIWERFPV